MGFFQLFLVIQSIENQYSMYKEMTISIKDFFSTEAALQRYSQEKCSENM